MFQVNRVIDSLERILTASFVSIPKLHGEGESAQTEKLEKESLLPRAGEHENHGMIVS